MSELAAHQKAYLNYMTKNNEIIHFSKLNIIQNKKKNKFTCSKSFPTVFNKLHKHSSGSSSCLVIKLLMQYNIQLDVRIFCLNNSPINLNKGKIFKNHCGYPQF